MARTDVAPATPGDSVDAAAERMRTAGTQALAVTDGGEVVGVVTLRDVANVEVLLDRLAEDVPHP